MRKLSLGLAGLAAFFGFTSGAHASTITLDLSAAALSGGVTLIGGGTDLKFAADAIGTATFTIPSVPGQEFVIHVTGQSDQSSSFVQFFINGVQLGSNTNFGSGFNTMALPSFIDTGTSDAFSITNGGTGNTENQITTVTVNDPPVPAPTPVALPLFATGLGVIGGLLAWRRKRRASRSVFLGDEYPDFAG